MPHQRTPLHTTRLLAASCAAFAITLLPAQELKGRKWSHEKFGIALTIPPGFSEVPLQIDEKWIAAKFLSDKSYLSKDRDWNREHKPLMRVIVFSEKAKKSSGQEVHESEDGKTTFVGIGSTPYQGYRDYVKRHRTGFFFSKEDEDTIGGSDCLMCEIDVHKSEPKLHLYSVVFRRPTFELAVEFEALEDRKDKVEKHIRRCLDSIRFVEPVGATEASITGKKGGRRTSTRLWTAFRSEWDKRPIEERTEIRKDMEADHHRRVRKLTPDGWAMSESKHFFVVSHADKKFSEKMVKGAELFYTWCEKRFGELGEDYVRRPVLRLCKDFDEYKAFHFDSSNSTGWALSGADQEIGTYFDTSNGNSGRDVSILFGGILRHFLQEKDSHIISYTPYWLTWAVDNYVSEVYVKGRKLDFKVDGWARDEARQMHRDGKLPKLQDLLTMSEAQFTKMRNKDNRANYAASQALRYVLGPGKNEKAFKDFLYTYFEATIAVAEGHGKDWLKLDHKSAETEEEEEAQQKEYSKRTKERAKQLQKEINEMVFASMTDKKWEKHEKAYAKFVKKGK
ncbi:MAG: hypothetical protein AB8H80_09500 [Planctomycetota bacterium]